jgi:hypothetical protein
MKGRWDYVLLHMSTAGTSMSDRRLVAPGQSAYWCVCGLKRSLNAPCSNQGSMIARIAGKGMGCAALVWEGRST